MEFVPAESIDAYAANPVPVAPSSTMGREPLPDHFSWSTLSLSRVSQPHSYVQDVVFIHWTVRPNPVTTE